MTTPDPNSAKAALDAFLGTYGLQSLGDFAWNEYSNGTPIEKIMLDIRSSDTYKQAFPAIADAIKNGDIPAGDGQENAYRALTGKYQEVNHAFGLPAGFYDTPEKIAKFISGRVSPQEYADRIQQYTGAVMGDTETLNEMQRLYGTVGHQGSPTGDLLAHYVDPDVAMPLLTQQLQTSQFASASKRSGFGQLTQAEAETFGSRAGVDERTARVGFEELTRGKELFQALPGQAEQDISRDVQLGAVAFGGNALDTNEIRKRREQRVAQGQGAQSFATGRAGASGLGAQQV